jgi:hypothetical protein
MYLRDRRYLVWTGGIEELLEVRTRAINESDIFTPHLRWPRDREWFVASHPELSSTYVGGPASLVAALSRDSRLEVLPVRSDDSLWETAPWIDEWAIAACDRLLDTGSTTVRTPLGEVVAVLKTRDTRPNLWLETTIYSDLKVSLKQTRGIIFGKDRNGERESIVSRLVRAILALVGD